ncbi:MAG: hypothetical protein GY854_34020 [Deltaproteobacteria bacterium]|nr:hypothetical protein [Deltaproteobacteria bacterium]
MNTKLNRGGNLEISQKELSAISELVNIGLGRGASILNTLLSSHIKLHAPIIKFLSMVELESELAYYREVELFSVEMGFSGEIDGNMKLVFTHDCASKLVHALTGDLEIDEDIDTLRAGTLNEVGNIVINSIIGAISNELCFSLRYSVPNYMQGSYDSIISSSSSDLQEAVLHVRAHFVVEQLDLRGDLMIFLETNSLRNISTAICDLEKRLGE